MRLAKLGEKVCLIDADIGLKNLDIVLGLENRIVYTMIDVVNGKVSPQEALVKHKMLKNLYLLPASQIATKEMISPNDMKAIVKELIPHFDYIIIDSPAGIERGSETLLPQLRGCLLSQLRASGNLWRGSCDRSSGKLRIFR